MSNGNIGGPDKWVARFLILAVLALVVAGALLYVGVIKL